MFCHRNIKGVVYALGADTYDIDDQLHRGRQDGLKLSQSGSVIKELLPSPEAYLLLFRTDPPIAPADGSFVRLLPSSNYPNSLAYVVQTDTDTQIIHLLVLPLQFEYSRHDGNISTTPFLEKHKSRLSHDYRRTAHGLLRGCTVTECVQSRNIVANIRELEVLEECDFEPVREATKQLKRVVINGGDRLRVIAGKYIGLVGWAAGCMVSDIMEIMPLTPILDHDLAGIEVSTTDLQRNEVGEGDDVMVTRGPFSGVMMKIIEYIEDDLVHGKISFAVPNDVRAKVCSHEFIRIVEIGDYVKVDKGDMEGCMGYAVEDRWHRCLIYVDKAREADETRPGLQCMVQNWVRYKPSQVTLH